MNSHVRALAELNTKQWHNALEGVDEATAWKRPAPGTNSIGFLALHLVWARYSFARRLGLEVENPFSALDPRNIDKLQELLLGRMRQAWDDLAPAEPVSIGRL